MCPDPILKTAYERSHVKIFHGTWHKFSLDKHEFGRVSVGLAQLRVSLTFWQHDVEFRRTCMRHFIYNISITSASLFARRKNFVKCYARSWIHYIFITNSSYNLFQITNSSYKKLFVMHFSMHLFHPVASLILFDWCTFF